MFPVRKEEDNLYQMNISDEEIDVLNSDDDDNILRAGDPAEEPFRHPPEVYMVNDEGSMYEDEEMQFQAYMEEEPQDNSQRYAGTDNPEYIDAHYINTDLAYLAEKEADDLYQLFENPDNVVHITKEERLAKYPEMRQLPAFRRPAKLRQALAKEQASKEQPSNEQSSSEHSSNEQPAIKQEDVVHRQESKCLATRKLLAASNVYSGPSMPLKLLPEVVNLQDSQTFLSLPRLAIARALPKGPMPMRKVHKPRHEPFPEPKHVEPRPASLMTPLPDRYFQKRLTLSAEQAGFTSECVSCMYCNCSFRQMALLNTHLKKHSDKNEVMSETAGLLCPVKTCPARCDSIATVVKHMRLSHSLTDIAFERIVFRNMTEFKMWRIELERLTMAKFTRTSGKQNIFSKSVYYQCQHSGNIPVSKEPDVRKQRNRQSKKLGRTCTAFFHVREHDDGTVLLRGCTKHSGHGRDVRQLPLTDDIRTEIAHLIILGLDENEIVNKMREESDASNRRYYLQNYEVRNVYNKVNKFKAEYKRKQAAGVPLPDLLESVTGKDSRERPVFSIGRARLACSRFPAVVEPTVQEEFAESVHTPIDDYDCEEPAQPTNPQYEEVIEDDGVFHVPSLPAAVPYEEREKKPIRDIAADQALVDKLLEMPNKIKGRRRDKVKSPKIEDPPQKEEVKDIAPIGRNTARKNAAKRQRINPNLVEYEDDEYDEASTSTAIPDPTSLSYGLTAKKEDHSMEDGIIGTGEGNFIKEEVPETLEEVDPADMQLLQ